MNIQGGFGTGNEIAYREEIPELGERFSLTPQLRLLLMIIYELNLPLTFQDYKN